MSTPSQAAQRRLQSPVLAAAKACEPAARALLEQLVQIDSGTGDVDGITAMDTILKAQLEELGATVERVPTVAPVVGDNLVARLKGSGKGRVLVIAHMDTVFPHGTVAQRPYTVIDEHGVGPGAGDDKGGVVAAVCALRVLHQIYYRDYAQLTLILNSNEETGSAGTRELIATQAKASDVVINLEGGIPPDAVVVNLGTNDFSTEPHPDTEEFISAQIALLKRIRKAYPYAVLACFVSSGWPNFLPYTETAVKRLQDAGEAKLFLLTYEGFQPEELGCDYHPKAWGHRRLAEQLAPWLKEKLGW